MKLTIKEIKKVGGVGMCADTSFWPYLLCYNFCLISERMFFIKINFPNN